ncbi:transcription factor bHLH94-like [Canna indica]|uniref:Transcription factor bHLH94-like n=1 Tax=Canna indica TaxID=4628 RepID=A0AAQ3Q3Y7_9LILI|nr:transcription factor bHLH94-like [Canna indica]
MALEAVVFPQGLFGCGFKEWCNGGGAWNNDLGELIEDEKRVVPKCEMAGDVDGYWDPSSSTVQNLHWNGNSSPSPMEEFIETAGRRKRRRPRSVKNKEEVESQRMTHIAVERNRRRQMNEYLATLRSLMPCSYVQKGDQASIVAGAINYVKELEQLLQSLEVQKQLQQQGQAGAGACPASALAEFFTFPQYSYNFSNNGSSDNDSVITEAENLLRNAEKKEAAATIEVTMVESHANLKVLSPQRPKQLLKLVSALQSLRLEPLHLNVSSVHEMVMYCFSLKVEDDCQYTSVDEIATAVNQMLGSIQEEANL